MHAVVDSFPLRSSAFGDLVFGRVELLLDCEYIGHLASGSQDSPRPFRSTVYLHRCRHLCHDGRLRYLPCCEYFTSICERLQLSHPLPSLTTPTYSSLRNALIIGERNTRPFLLRYLSLSGRE